MASSEYTITVERIVWNADTLLYSRYSSERLRSDGRSDFYRRYVSGLPAEGWHQANTQSQSNELFGMPTHFYTLATLRRDSAWLSVTGKLLGIGRLASPSAGTSI